MIGDNRPLHSLTLAEASSGKAPGRMMSVMAIFRQLARRRLVEGFAQEFKPAL